MKKISIEVLIPICLFILCLLTLFDVFYMISFIQNLEEMLYIDKTNTMIMFIKIVLFGFLGIFSIKKLFLYWKNKSKKKQTGIITFIICFISIAAVFCVFAYSMNNP